MTSPDLSQTQSGTTSSSSLQLSRSFSSLRDATEKLGSKVIGEHLTVLEGIVQEEKEVEETMLVEATGVERELLAAHLKAAGGLEKKFTGFVKGGKVL